MPSGARLASAHARNHVFDDGDTGVTWQIRRIDLWAAVAMQLAATITVATCYTCHVHSAKSKSSVWCLLVCPYSILVWRIWKKSHGKYSKKLNHAEVLLLHPQIQQSSLLCSVVQHTTLWFPPLAIALSNIRFCHAAASDEFHWPQTTTLHGGCCQSKLRNSICSSAVNWVLS